MNYSDSEQEQRLTIINRLLASFPSTTNGQGDDALDGYLIGTRDVPADFLAIAAQRFLAGSVPGQNMTFPPSPAQLANEARQHWYKQLDREREERARLAPPPEPEVSEAERERVKAGFERLRAQLAVEKRTDDADRAKRSKERGEAELRWLKQRGDLVELPGLSVPVSATLMSKFEVGDSDGDRDVA